MAHSSGKQSIIIQVLRQQELEAADSIRPIMGKERMVNAHGGSVQDLGYGVPTVAGFSHSHGHGVPIVGGLFHSHGHGVPTVAGLSHNHGHGVPIVGQVSHNNRNND